MLLLVSSFAVSAIPRSGVAAPPKPSLSAWTKAKHAKVLEPAKAPPPAPTPPPAAASPGPRSKGKSAGGWTYVLGRSREKACGRLGSSTT